MQSKDRKNHHGFTSAVLGVFCPNIRLSTTLPQKLKNTPYIPSDENVQCILAYARGTRYEIPIILACYGLRRSEICALTVDDIDADIMKMGGWETDHIMKSVYLHDKYFYKYK